MCYSGWSRTQRLSPTSSATWRIKVSMENYGVSCRRGRAQVKLLFCPLNAVAIEMIANKLFMEYMDRMEAKVR